MLTDSLGEAALDALDNGKVETAAALLLRMHAADQGILLERASAPERRRLIAQLTLSELSDILDEAPTNAAVTITRELSADHAADLLDDVDSHTVADILQELPDEHIAAIIAELDRPQDVVPLLQYPPDTAGGMMTPDFPGSGASALPAMPWTLCAFSERMPRASAGFVSWTKTGVLPATSASRNWRWPARPVGWASWPTNTATAWCRCRRKPTRKKCTALCPAIR